MPRDFVRTLLRHSREVAAFEGTQADEYRRLLRDVLDALTGRLARAVEGDDPITEARLVHVLGETRTAMATLEEKMLGRYVATARDALDLSIAHIADEVRVLSTAFEPRPFHIAIDAARVWTDPAQRLLAQGFASSVNRYGSSLLSDIRRHLAVSLQVGTPSREVIREIAGKQGPLGGVGLRRGEMLFRTEASNVYGTVQHAGLKQAAEQVPGLSKIWIHVGSYKCPTCMPLHGTARPLNGTWTIQVAKGPPRRTKQVAHPPAHSSCVCRVSSMKPSWRAGLQRLGYLGPQAKHEPTAGEAGP